MKKKLATIVIGQLFFYISSHLLLIFTFVPKYAFSPQKWILHFYHLKKSQFDLLATLFHKKNVTMQNLRARLKAWDIFLSGKTSGARRRLSICGREVFWGGLFVPWRSKQWEEHDGEKKQEDQKANLKSEKHLLKMNQRIFSLYRNLYCSSLVSLLCAFFCPRSALCWRISMRNG